VNVERPDDRGRRRRERRDEQGRTGEPHGRSIYCRHE
jgi:hypothetical protein